MINVVTKCSDCPLLYDTISCRHPDAPTDMDFYEDGFDQWESPHRLCPLRGNKLVIELVEP